MDKETQTISWSKPTHFGGNLSFYEVKIESKIDGTDHEAIYLLKEHRCQMTNLCPKETNEYKILVRAVNVIASDLSWIMDNDSNETGVCEIDNDLIDLSGYELLPGEWSETSYSCYSNKFFTQAFLFSTMLIIIIFILCGIGLYFLYNEIYRCCSIEIEVPETLKEISIYDVSNAKMSDSLFKRLFLRRRRPAVQQRSPDIIFVHASNEYMGHSITREPNILIDDTPQQNERNEYLEPLLQAPVNFRTAELRPIDETPEVNFTEIGIPLTHVPMAVNTNRDSAPYVLMTALEHRLPPPQEQLPVTGDYVPITKGFTQTNYVGTVIQPTPRNFIKDMLRISQLQQQEQQTPIETSFQQPTRPGISGKWSFEQWKKIDTAVLSNFQTTIWSIKKFLTTFRLKHDR